MSSTWHVLSLAPSAKNVGSFLYQAHTCLKCGFTSVVEISQDPPQSCPLCTLKRETDARLAALHNLHVEINEDITSVNKRTLMAQPHPDEKIVELCIAGLKAVAGARSAFSFSSEFELESEWAVEVITKVMRETIDQMASRSSAAACAPDPSTPETRTDSSRPHTESGGAVLLADRPSLREIHADLAAVATKVFALIAGPAERAGPAVDGDPDS